MQNTLPEVGKIYRSKTEPAISIYVEKVDLIEADEDCEEGFHVEGCDPRHIGKPWADGIEMTGDEWNEHGFAQFSMP